VVRPSEMTKTAVLHACAFAYFFFLSFVAFIGLLANEYVCWTFPYINAVGKSLDP